MTEDEQHEIMGMFIHQAAREAQVMVVKPKEIEPTQEAAEAFLDSWYEGYGWRIVSHVPKNVERTINHLRVAYRVQFGHCTVAQENERLRTENEELKKKLAQLSLNLQGGGYGL